jgi:pimeloyl-ACP methyl ester carboxylesterase
MNSGKKSFVLVHGAWHGGWCWRRVSDLLAAQGHRVFCPTLTGLGERSHLMSADINLDTHITDVANVILWEDLEDVTLVGHSYGGWPISGAVERVPERIGGIVYLDAFIPEDGDSGIEITSPESKISVQQAIKDGAISRPIRPARDYGLTDADDIAWVDSKLTRQPLGVSLQKIQLTGARERLTRKAYILATGLLSPVFKAYYDGLESDPSWRRYEAPCGHDVMVEMPELLAEILLEVSE